MLNIYYLLDAFRISAEKVFKKQTLLKKVRGFTQLQSEFESYLKLKFSYTIIAFLPDLHGNLCLFHLIIRFLMQYTFEFIDLILIPPGP